MTCTSRVVPAAFCLAALAALAAASAAACASSEASPTSTSGVSVDAMPSGASVGRLTESWLTEEPRSGSDDAGEAMRFRKRAGAAKADSARVIGHLVGGACV